MSATIPAEGGVLGLLKPSGMTSHDVVHACRNLLGTKEIGHAGTLDPLAAGVLPLLFGPATRLAEQLAWPAKTYRAEVLFGIKTTSGDFEGQVVAADDPAAVAVSAAKVAEAIARLVGRQTQEPSPFSARKVDGRPLYELARRGKVAARQLRQAAREIRVYGARLLWHGRLAWGVHAGRPAALIEVVCSTGTYVRQLVEELGESLGTVACTAFLVRTACAGFTADDCVTFEELAVPAPVPAAVRFGAAWRRPAEAIGFLPRFTVDAVGARQIGHGMAVPCVGPVGPGGDAAGKHLADEAGGWAYVVDGQLRLLALARLGPAMVADAPGGLVIQPKKVFPSC